MGRFPDPIGILGVQDNSCGSNWNTGGSRTRSDRSQVIPFDLKVIPPDPIGILGVPPILTPCRHAQLQLNLSEGSHVSTGLDQWCNAFPVLAVCVRMLCGTLDSLVHPC